MRTIVDTKQKLYKMQKDLSKQLFIALDTETENELPKGYEGDKLQKFIDTFRVENGRDPINGLDPYSTNLVVLQIATRENSYAIPWFFLMDAINVIRPILENDNIVKIIHNSAFDFKIIWHFLHIRIKRIFDTRWAERVLSCGMLSVGAKLSELSLRYLGKELDKAEQLSFKLVKEFLPEQQEYMFDDVEILFPIFDAQTAKIRELKLEKVIKLENELAPVTAMMEYNGFLVHRDNWIAFIKEREVELEDLRRELEWELTPKKFKEAFPEQARQLNKLGVINLSSEQQLWIYLSKNGTELYEENRFTGEKKKSTKAQVISDEIWKYEKLSGKGSAPKVLYLIQQHRKLSKLLDAFGWVLINKINKITGRIHPGINQVGADSGRFSMYEPNLQQLPKKDELTRVIRSFLIAPDGYKIISVDQSQMELRIAAELSQDQAMREMFETGLDIHQSTTSKMYGIPFDQVTKDQRRIGKTINFGLLYGTGAYKLHQQTRMELKDAYDARKKYFTVFSGVKKFLDDANAMSISTLESRDLLGRLRKFTKPDKDAGNYKEQQAEIGRAGANHLIQGLNAEITKQALIDIYEALIEKNYDAKVISTIHDEIVVECKEEQAEEVSLLMKELIIKSGQVYLKTIPVDVGINIGDCWE